MSFYEIVEKINKENLDRYTQSIDPNDIHRVLGKRKLDEYDFLTLLSDEAIKHLEPMAKRANMLTMQHFGRVILIYTPMYLANYCVNRCIYCSFNAQNNIKRKKLDLDEVEQEAKIISSTGHKHILILTGESRIHTPVSYIRDCVEVLKKYFKSISIEIYPLKTEEYKDLIDAGVDGLTIYQEVYNNETYKELHLKGPKRNYMYRLDAPERACKASMRSVNIGALLGLSDWRKEAFLTGLHANYLQNKYPDVEISISLPRIRPHVGKFTPECEVSDKHLVQIMLAMRLFLPRAGITISTRENAKFRDNLIGLGVTKMSADSTTQVGGHSSNDKGDGQFEISDNRSVKEIKKMIHKKGFQPVFKDWEII